MKNFIKSLSLLTFGVFALSGSARAACGEVSITDMNWASGAIVTAVSTFLMEEGYGCKVAKVPSSTIPAATSMAETGKPDIVTEMWVNGAPVYKELEKSGKVITVANVLSDGGEESWWIPKYLADKYPELKELKNVLANPAKVGGKFHNCPVGWGCRTVNDNLIKAWNMENVKGLEVFDHGSGETLAASIASAYEDKKPWFGYYWAPTEILGKYPMVKVNMGSYVKKVHECNAKAECGTPGKSAYPSAPVLTGITADFKKREPEIAKLMGNITFSNQVLGSVLAWQKDKGASPDEAAVYFLTNHKDIWKNWISPAAKKKLSNLLK